MNSIGKSIIRGIYNNNFQLTNTQMAIPIHKFRPFWIKASLMKYALITAVYVLNR